MSEQEFHDQVVAHMAQTNVLLESLREDVKPYGEMAKTCVLHDKRISIIESTLEKLSTRTWYLILGVSVSLIIAFVKLTVNYLAGIKL